MIPWSEFVDNRALRASPRIYFDVYKDMFDYLHACEPGSLINIGIHSHFGGRPTMAAVFRQILEYLPPPQGRLVRASSRGGTMDGRAKVRRHLLSDALCPSRPMTIVMLIQKIGLSLTPRCCCASAAQAQDPVAKQARENPGAHRARRHRGQRWRGSTRSI